MTRRFSDREGYKGKDREIRIREDAPDELRAAIPQIALSVGMTPKPIRHVICQVLLKRPDPSNWSEYPNISDEVDHLIDNCEWFRVYDIAEALYAHLAEDDPSDARTFEARLNDFMREQGIGWEMGRGQLIYRGSEAFSESTSGAAEALEHVGYVQAASEMHEALADISRRPRPDVTGAIQHVMAALEATAREVTGDRKATLGKIIHDLDLPSPLDVAIDKLWGYSSDRARHVSEGKSVEPAEAELIVTVACAVCSYLLADSEGSE